MSVGACFGIALAVLVLGIILYILNKIDYNGGCGF